MNYIRVKGIFFGGVAGFVLSVVDWMEADLNASLIVRNWQGLSELK